MRNSTRLAVVVLVSQLFCCKEALLGITPGVPNRDSTCARELDQTCHANVPVLCHADDHRWWPMLARRADGTQRTCITRCVVEEGIAYCAGE